MPIVKVSESPLEILAVQLQFAVPTFGSEDETKTTLAVQSVAPPSRLTNVTEALVISPAKASAVGSTAVMSLIVADNITAAVLLVVLDVATKDDPV